MTDEQLKERAAEMQKAALTMEHPLLPKAAKTAIQGAVGVVAELVKREVKRNAKIE